MEANLKYIPQVHQCDNKKNVDDNGGEVEQLSSGHVLHQKVALK